MAAAPSPRCAPGSGNQGLPRDETEARPVTPRTRSAHDGGMTTSSHIEPATVSRWNAHRILASLPEAALAALAFALVTGAWLTFFLVVPFDFRVR